MPSTTALITGASSGIGLELAKQFARHGHGLILVSRSEESLTQLAAMLRTEFECTVDYIAADLTDAAQRERLYSEVQARGLQVDILVNDAGEGAFGKFTDIEWSRMQYLIELNVTALTHLTHLFLPGMVRRGQGRVLNLASIASFEPGPLLQVYHATKAYVLYLTEALAWEYEPAGIRFTALAPGATDTDFFEKAEMEQSPMADPDQLADPADVAKYGYEQLMAGQTVAVYGLKNKLYASMYRFLPRKAVTALMGSQYQPSGDHDRDGRSAEGQRQAVENYGHPSGGSSLTNPAAERSGHLNRSADSSPSADHGSSQAMDHLRDDDPDPLNRRDTGRGI